MNRRYAHIVARRVMAEHLGRPLTSDEIVHHKDRDHKNNDVANLEIMTSAQHGHHHHGTRRERPHRTKLTRTEVSEIRASTLSQRKLATMYGISQPQVHKIMTGQSWRDL